jgi:hypothetical protein
MNIGTKVVDQKIALVVQRERKFSCSTGGDASVLLESTQETFSCSTGEMITSSSMRHVLLLGKGVSSPVEHKIRISRDD